MCGVEGASEDGEGINVGNVVERARQIAPVIIGKHVGVVMLKCTLVVKNVTEHGTSR